MNYIECPMYLWLSKHRPDLLPQDTPEKERIFAMGRQVDELAKKLFDGGREVEGFGNQGWASTQEAMTGGPSVLFQPTAIAGDISCRADILVKNSDSQTWDIYEVKMSTKVQKEYLFDVGFQRLCFERAGIKIGHLKLVHINKEYVRQGSVNPQELFTIEDITRDVDKKVSEIEDYIGRALECMNVEEPVPAPLINSCANPKYCEYLEYYAQELVNIAEFAHQVFPSHLLQLLERGVWSGDDLPAQLLESAGYVPETPFTNINARGIKAELEKLEYPLYFFDYETYASAIPPFDSTKPYQQLPFQYSLTIKDAPDSIMRHEEFLMPVFENPVPDLLSKLKKDIGPKGTVIVWYALFEMGRNKEMAVMEPEYADFLHDINKRMFDLMLIFKFKNGLYTKSEFKKLASLKIILPVLRPDLSYKFLAIQEGGTASASWPVVTGNTLSKLEKKKLWQDMLAYCQRDTDAMLAILDKVCEDTGINKF